MKLRQQPSLASLADDLRLTELSAGLAIVSAPTNTKANYARTRQATLAEILSEVTGSRVRVEVRLAQGVSARSAQAPAPSSVAHAEAVKDPLVRRAMELFDARVVDVSDDPRGGARPPDLSGARPADASDADE